MLWWWKIWLLSTSAFLNTQLSSLSTGEEVISFFFSSLHHHPLLFISASLHFIYLLATSLFISFPLWLLFGFFFQHFLAFASTLLLSVPSFLLCSSSAVLSVEQPIQQQNKAAYSITHWLIKQDQNAAALRSTQQHHDTGQQRDQTGCHIKRRAI